MGGGHHAKVHIPDYKVYKVEAVPELMAVQRALASKGLKDPWLRNEVWKYDISQKGTTAQIFKRTLGRGIWWGLGAAIITTAIEKYMTSGDHHHGHGEEGHH
jgi:NADH dehydrogenase (ubiquinone) 1 beta subcomplex subunit 3